MPWSPQPQVSIAHNLNVNLSPRIAEEKKAIGYDKLYFKMPEIVRQLEVPISCIIIRFTLFFQFNLFSFTSLRSQWVRQFDVGGFYFYQILNALTLLQ